MSTSAISNTLSVTLFNGSIERRNANGALLGRTLSFIGKAPAGDVKKALAATGLKGKALKAAVGNVLRGELDTAWALYGAQASVARSMGYVPINLKGNKSGEVLTARFEKAPQSAEEQAKSAASTMSAKDLIEIAKSKLTEQDKELLEVLEKLTGAKPAEKPAIEV